MVKGGWIDTEPSAEYSSGRKSTSMTVRQFCSFGSSLKNYVEVIMTHGLHNSH